MENLYHHHHHRSTSSSSNYFVNKNNNKIPWSSSSSSSSCTSSSTSSSSSSSSAFQICGFPSKNYSVSIPMMINELDDDPNIYSKASAASKSHSQAEKRRRDRINSQLSTLRKLIPMSDKMDKAALLGSVIEHVKDLKRKATEIGKSLTVPTEVDEITIDTVDVSVEDSTSAAAAAAAASYIRASVCCDDRPELFSELIQVLNGLRLTAVRADVASIGGRIKSVLVLTGGGGGDGERGVCVNALRQSLKVVLSKIASQSVVTNCRVRSKRQRFFLPSNSHCTDHHHHHHQ